MHSRYDIVRVVFVVMYNMLCMQERNCSVHIHQQRNWKCRTKRAFDSDVFRSQLYISRFQLNICTPIRRIRRQMFFN